MATTVINVGARNKLYSTATVSCTSAGASSTQSTLLVFTWIDGTGSVTLSTPPSGYTAMFSGYVPATDNGQGMRVAVYYKDGIDAAGTKQITLTSAATESMAWATVFSDPFRFYSTATYNGSDWSTAKTTPSATVGAADSLAIGLFISSYPRIVSSSDTTVVVDAQTGFSGVGMFSKTVNPTSTGTMSATFDTMDLFIGATIVFGATTVTEDTITGSGDFATGGTISASNSTPSVYVGGTTDVVLTLVDTPLGNPIPNCWFVLSMSNGNATVTQLAETNESGQATIRFTGVAAGNTTFQAIAGAASTTFTLVAVSSVQSMNAPTLLSVSAPTGRRFNLSWSYNGGPTPTEVRIYSSTTLNGTYSLVSTGAYSAGYTNDTYYTATAQTTRYFKIEVYNATNGTAISSAVGTTSPANNAPVITSNGGGLSGFISIDEGTTAVTTVTSTDADSAENAAIPPQYSIIGGADAALFQINTSTGVLSFISAPSYLSPADADSNNQYLVNVQVSDGLATDVQALIVSVNQVVSGGTDYQVKAYLHRSALGAVGCYGMIWRKTVANSIGISDVLFDFSGLNISPALVGGKAELIVPVPAGVSVSNGEIVRIYIQSGAEGSPIFNATVYAI